MLESRFTDFSNHRVKRLVVPLRYLHRVTVVSGLLAWVDRCERAVVVNTRSEPRLKVVGTGT